MSNVRLAIRVRPFTERELRSEKDRISVVNVADEHSVTITNMKVSVSGAGDSRERTRRYYADYTFDSSYHTSHPAYASQEKVFDSIGREVIDSVSRGHSACVMAYGQSATGKTHTMTGSDQQPGLVPRLCRALDPLHTGLVTVSFLEIYNERVHDLLVGEAAPTCHSLPRRRGNSRKDLRVREHPNKGPYVQNLRRVAVHDIETLLALVNEGTRRRRTAATRRNSTSSRSHALLEIVTTNATLHLADLAGSEKASWEGCGGGRQKEGANINKSLVALSNVISALVHCGSGRGKFVPYRDSALTWLLKDCFTGGASTFIIATVSPSFACYGESASTLRWAERARQLPTPKNTNLGFNLTSKAVLQAQFNQLVSELARNYIIYIPETGKISYDVHHWNLQADNSSNIALTSAKIGNIMNIAHPKPDVNSESTASSVASGSSDVINTMDKNIKIVDEINKEVDKLFVPSLERTSSSTDLKMVAPLRHKRRQYKSQEILQLDEALVQSSNSVVSLPNSNSVQANDLTDKTKVPSITILHDSQRAEIVASVTERLYTKLKKKEEAAVSKVESVVDKKIMEPLSELRICTNARQRLMELSQKAMRHKRRIGIPAFTQTRVSVIRVKDQSVDVQTDLESYIVNKYQNSNSHAFYRDVATETLPMTPRCKEVAVGSKYGTLNLNDQSTCTDNKKVILKDSYSMTDILTKCEIWTQTPIVPPPRRKKRCLNINKKYLRNKGDQCEEETSAPVISINISQTYPVESESQTSDDSLPAEDQVKPSIVLTKPDLLTNHHCDINENKGNDKSICIEVNTAKINNVDAMSNSTDSLESTRQSEEFPDTDDCSLPRVSADPIKKIDQTEFKNIILGRNKNLYPYSIVVSPLKEKDMKRIVTFKDINVSHAINVASQTDWDTDIIDCDHWKHEPHSSIEDFDHGVNEYSSDTTDLGKVETDSFIWKDCNNAMNVKNESNTETFSCLGRGNYVPVYKTNPKPKMLRNTFYRQFLGLGDDKNENPYFLTEESGNNYSSTDSTEASTRSIYRNQGRNVSSLNLRRQNETHNTFDDVYKKITESCNDLQRSVNSYDNYLNNYRTKKRENKKFNTTRTPSAHLQHLVKLRREVVNHEGDTTE